MINAAAGVSGGKSQVAFGKFHLFNERKSGDGECSIPATAADSVQKVHLSFCGHLYTYIYEHWWDRAARAVV